MIDPPKPTRRETLTLIGAGIVGLAGCTGDDGTEATPDEDSGASVSTTETEGATTGRDDLEDEMTLYMTTDYGPVISEFEAEYGVTVNASVYSGPQTTSRFRTEEEAGNHNASALIGAADALAWSSVRQYITEVDLPEENRDRVLTDQMIEQLERQDGVGKSWPILSMIRATPYNTNSVDEPPVEWDEFTDPEWEGRLVNPPYNMRRVYMALQLEGWDDDRIEEYMIALDESMDSYPESAPANVQQIVGGQAEVGVQLMDYFAQGSMADGAPIDLVYPPFTTAHYNAVGVSKNAPSPNLATQFADWATSEAGQRAVQEAMGMNPADPDMEHGNDTIQGILDEYDPTIHPLIPTEEEINESTEYLNSILSVEVG